MVAMMSLTGRWLIYCFVGINCLVKKRSVSIKVYKWHGLMTSNPNRTQCNGSHPKKVDIHSFGMWTGQMYTTWSDSHDRTWCLLINVLDHICQVFTKESALQIYRSTVNHCSMSFLWAQTQLFFLARRACFRSTCQVRVRSIYRLDFLPHVPFTYGFKFFVAPLAFPRSVNHIGNSENIQFFIGRST